MTFLINLTLGFVFLGLLVLVHYHLDKNGLLKSIRLWMKLIIYLMVFTLIYYFIASYNKKDPHFKKGDTELKRVNLWDCFYFSVITQSTIGYGNMKPNSLLCEFIVCIQALGTIMIVVDHTSRHFTI